MELFGVRECDYTTYEEIAALGHDFGDWTVTTAPTCAEAGEETRYCSRCDATETQSVDALGHELEHVGAKAATDTEDGNIEYWYCPACGKYFSDEEAENEIDEEDTVIPKTAALVIGDVNGDGLITIKDISELKILLAGALDEGGVTILNCDISGDEMVTIKDLQELKKLLA